MSANEQRKAAEHAYITTAFDYAKSPIGSRDWCLFWDGWQAARATPPQAEGAIPAGWALQRLDCKPFLGIEVKAPNGHVAAVYSHNRNPENVLYMLADALLSTPARALKAEAAQPAGEPVIGYLPAYELDRLKSGHDARLRSAKFGASALDGDVAVSLTSPPQVQRAGLTDERIARHSIAAGDCPPSSEVILVSSLRRLLGVTDSAAGDKP